MNNNAVELGGIAVQETPKGLEFSVTDRSQLPDADGIKGESYFWIELVEPFWANGYFQEIRPEEIGAMTDSIIFEHRSVRQPDGELVAVGDVYWYPSYMVEDPAVELLTGGKIVFTRDPDGAERHRRMQSLLNGINSVTNGPDWALDYRMRGFPVRAVCRDGDYVVKEYEDVIRENASGRIVECELNAERRLLDWLEGFWASLNN